MASKKAAQKSLSLAPVLDLNEATALHQQLMGLKGNPLVIDASAVERVGALCVQVLMLQPPMSCSAIPLEPPKKVFPRPNGSS